MSYVLEALGRGLLGELSVAFRELFEETDACTIVGDPASDTAVPSRYDCTAGIRQLRERNYGAARDRFQKALSLVPTDFVARVGLACALDELGLPRSGVEQLQIAVEHHPDRAAVWFALGFCQEKVGDCEDALTSYEQAVELDPSLRNAHERLAAIHVKNENVAAAITHYEQICWAEPGDVNSTLTLANLFARVERFDDAIARFQFALAIDPDNWEAPDELVATCIEAGKLESALEVQRQLVEKRPEAPQNHLKLGDLLSKCGRLKEALDSYRLAAALHPDSIEAHIRIGSLHLRNGDYAEACDAFSRAAELNDRIVNAYVGLGVAQQALGKGDEALASFEMAAAVEPNSTLLFSETARLQFAVAAAEQSKRYLSPAAVTAHSERPPSRRIVSLFGGQVARLRKALREHPHHADLHYRLGLLLRQVGDLEGAIECYRKAVRINPQYAKAQVKLGLALREAGRPDEALRVFEEAIKIDRESIDLHYELGLIFADRGQFDQALGRFESAASAEPGNRDYVAHLALALQNMGLVDRAAATWQTLADVTAETVHDMAATGSS